MSQPQAFNCPSCTATLDYDGRSETIRCEFCGTSIIVPDSIKQSASVPGFIGDENPAQGANIHEILRLVQRGQKIEAIKLYRETFNVSLAEAKEAVEQLEHGRPTAVIMTTAAATTTAATTGCGCLLPIIIFLIIGGIGAYFFYSESPDQFNRLSQAISEGDFSQIAEDVGTTLSNQAVFNEPILLSEGGDGLAPDLLLETWTYGGAQIPISLASTTFADGRRQVQWQAKVGDSSGWQYNVGFDSQKVYIAQGSALQAHDWDSGEMLWQTVLSDEVNQTCRVCIRTLKDRVIVLTSDNTLEAFDTNTGRSAWQVRLEKEYFSYPDTGQIAFGLVDGLVAILDDTDIDGRARTALKLFSAATGEEIRQIIPLCPDIDNFFDDDSISNNSQIFLNESSGELVALYGTTFVGQMCLQKWNVTTGEQLLNARVPENFALNSRVPGGMVTEWSGSPFAQFTPEQLITTLQINENDIQNPGVVKFDLNSGEIVFQQAVKDYDLAPIAQADNVMLVRAERKRGTKQHEIWGLDSSSGEQLWKHILQADYLYELDPFDDRFSVHLQPDGLVIVQVLTDSEPSELVVQKLNTVDGSLLYETETALSEDFWRGLTWTNDSAYLALRNLVAVDLETGKTAVEWP